MHGWMGLMGVVWPNDLASWNLNYSPPAFPVWSWQLARPHPLPLANTFKGEGCFADGSHLLSWSHMRERALFHSLPCLQTVSTTSESWHNPTSSQVSSLCHKKTTKIKEFTVLPWFPSPWEEQKIEPSSHLGEWEKLVHPENSASCCFTTTNAFFFLWCNRS